MSTIQQVERIQAHRQKFAPMYRNHNFAVRCMKCNREKIGKSWISTGLTKAGTIISHGVCPECSEFYKREMGLSKKVIAC